MDNYLSNKPLNKIKYWKEFTRHAAFNKRSKVLQPFYRPFDVFKYFLLTRIATITNKAIPAKAKLFFEKELKGEFPDVVFSFAYLYHFVENDLTHIMMKNLKPGMVFIDGGAHVGYFTLLASYLVGEKGQVHSFEVTPRTFQKLKVNAAGLDNVIINNIAIWSKKTTLDFFDYGLFYAPNNNYVEAKMVERISKNLKPKRFKTQTITLDEYIKKNKIIPNVIKLDLEYADYEGLRGSLRSIKKYKPLLVVEYGYNPDSKLKGTRECIMLLKDLHYEPYVFVDGKLIKHKMKDNYMGVWGNLYFLHNHHRNGKNINIL
ncbi:MAG: FkbM family methyltransferase [bacterium]|nr:FkbM family methyltransferase [bacterium]